LAFSSHPLGISVDGVQAASGGRHVEAVTVTVRNLTRTRERPHFMVNAGSGTAGFWGAAGGRGVVLGPHGSVKVTLRAPVTTTAPQHGAHWLVEAYTTGPRS
jgi:hypothetical protein